MEIDLNSDLGEGCPNDAELMPLISSANISCGAHAGDPETALRVLRLAAQFGVRVGAHPSYPDREHFGRRELALPPERILEDCLYQVGALMGLARAVSLSIEYIKPHGALYNQACRDIEIAKPLVEAARLLGLPLMGLPNSVLEQLARPVVGFLTEGFADRRYLPDGRLVSRTMPHAMLVDPDEAAEQVVRLIRERGVQSLCVHGDNPDVVPFVKSLRECLSRRGVGVRQGKAGGVR